METDIVELFPEMAPEPPPLPPNPLERLYTPADISAFTRLSSDQIARLSAQKLIEEDDFAPGNRPRYKCPKLFLFRVWKFLRSADNLDVNARKRNGRAHLNKKLFSYHRAVRLFRRIKAKMEPHKGRFADCKLYVDAHAGRRKPRFFMVHGEADFELEDQSWLVIDLHAVVEEIAQFCQIEDERRGMD